MADPITYVIDKMRVNRVNPKSKNPKGFALLVKGVFHSTTRDDKGNLVKGDALTFGQKGLTREIVNSPEFSMSIENGTLTIPNGREGRPTVAGLTGEELDTFLADLRDNGTDEGEGEGENPEPATDPEPAATDK